MRRDIFRGQKNASSWDSCLANEAVENCLLNLPTAAEAQPYPCLGCAWPRSFISLHQSCRPLPMGGGGEWFQEWDGTFC